MNTVEDYPDSEGYNGYGDYGNLNDYGKDPGSKGYGSYGDYDEIGDKKDYSDFNNHKEGGNGHQNGERNMQQEVSLLGPFLSYFGLDFSVKGKKFFVVVIHKNFEQMPSKGIHWPCNFFWYPGLADSPETWQLSHPISASACAL